MQAKDNQNQQAITCRLGCIYFFVNLYTGDWCTGGLFPARVCEGTTCARGYNQAEMAKILAQEEAENKVLRQKDSLATLVTF